MFLVLVLLSFMNSSSVLLESLWKRFVGIVFWNVAMCLLSLSNIEKSSVGLAHVWLLDWVTGNLVKDCSKKKFERFWKLCSVS